MLAPIQVSILNRPTTRRPTPPGVTSSRSTSLPWGLGRKRGASVPTATTWPRQLPRGSWRQLLRQLQTHSTENLSTLPSTLNLKKYHRLFSNDKMLAPIQVSILNLEPVRKLLMQRRYHFFGGSHCKLSKSRTDLSLISTLCKMSNLMHIF